jgi:hypothetical protein
MSKLNNPAGRLHELLTAFRDNGSPNATINATWCKALDVDQSELLPMLGQVAALLGEVRVAVMRSGRMELQELHNHFSAAWALPIFTHGRNPASDAGHDLIDAGALGALGSLAINFELVEPDGNIPDEELELAVKTDLHELLEQLAADTDLPAPLRAVISARVHDILWAMDHVKIVGPNGVEAAIERLVGQVAIFTADDLDPRRTSIFQRTMQAAARAWGAFRTPGEVHQAIEGWQKLLEILPPG